MSSRWILAALALGLVLPSAAAAQESAEKGQLAEIITWKVEPADAPTFEATIRKIVTAATQAKLSQGYGWFLYNDLFEYTLVFPVEAMAYFDDPQVWERQFEGTPGEPTLGEAFQAFGSLRYRTTDHHVIEEVEEWGYTPDKPPAETPWAHVDRFWVRPGSQPDFDALTKEFVAFLKEIGYGYEIVAHRVHFGEGQTAFVTFYDSREAFYGAKGLEALVSQKKAQQKYGDLVRRLSQLIFDADHFDTHYRPDLSYWPGE